MNGVGAHGPIAPAKCVVAVRGASKCNAITMVGDSCISKVGASGGDGDGIKLSPCITL